MSTLTRAGLVLTFPLLIAAYAACSDDADATPDEPPATDAAVAETSQPEGDANLADAAPTTLSLQFEGRVGAAPFACGTTYTNVGTTKATVTAGDLRFFVHAIRLSHGNGPAVPLTLEDRTPWQGSQVGLVDLEDKTGECAFGTSATNDVLTGSVPAGAYDTLSFEVGVPDALNHVNVETAGAPFAASKLQWDWANGFIHFAAQANPLAMITDDAGASVRAPSFYSHLGSTACAGGQPEEGGVSSCARKNRPSVTLTGFDAAKNKIVIDLAKLWEGSDLERNTEGTIPGCMSGSSDPECPPVFAHLGVDFATGNATGTQAVFAVAPR